MNSKQYGTPNNGNFFEVTDPATGITEFWSTKHSHSRYYNGGITTEMRIEITATPQPTTSTAHKITDPETGITRYWKSLERQNETTKWLVYLTKSERAARDLASGYASDYSKQVNGVKAVKCAR